MNARTRLALPLALAIVPLLGACASAPQEKHHAPPPTTEKLEPYQCGSIERLHTLNGVFLAGQPSAADFEQAKAGGVKAVVNFRKADEMTDFDEPAVVTGLGLEYHAIPFKTPDELTDEVFDRSRELLNDPSRRPILVHCASANRVGAVWLAHRVLDGGLTWEAALAEAKTVGLKLPAYEEKARAYVESHKR